jgi:hypothetical protein
VCLQQALEGVAEMVAPAAAAKGLELALLVDADVLARGPHFWGDATRVRQVLHHLASNAVKYSDAGEIVMRAALVESSSSSGGSSSGRNSSKGSGGGGGARTLAISVRDRGIGMSPELLAGLFQSFRQGSDALNRRYGGTGLGLALSKRLAEAMGGDIVVDSALGAGSTFTLLLRPAWCADDEPAAGADGAGGGGAGALAAGGCSGGSNGALSAAESAGAPPATSSGDLSSAGSSSGSACGSPQATAAAGAAAAGGGAAPRRSGPDSLLPSSVSSGDLGDGDSLICCCAAAHAHARGQLAGKAVWVDVPQPLVAEQACQMLAQLGMRPLRAPDAPAAGPPEGAEFAVASTCRAAAVLRAGWRGRPMVVIGSPDELPERLHPMVSLVGKPLRLGRLVAALQRAAGVLAWQGGAEHAPRLGRAPGWLLQPAAAPFGAAATAAAAAAGGAPAGGSRWRGRASIDNSALRNSPQSAVAAAAAAAAAALGAASAPARRPAAGGPSPPPLDLAGAGLQAAPGPAARPQASVLRGLKPLTAAVKSVFSGTPRPAAESRAAAEPVLSPTPTSPDGAPLPPLQSPQAPPGAPLPPPPQQPQPPAPPLQILIAEDNRVNQMVLCKVLKAVLPGCTPDVVANGLQVLDAVGAKAYDLIFMDGGRGGAGARRRGRSRLGGRRGKGSPPRSPGVREAHRAPRAARSGAPTQRGPQPTPLPPPPRPQCTCRRWTASRRRSASAMAPRSAGPRARGRASSRSPPTRSRRCGSAAQRRGLRCARAGGGGGGRVGLALARGGPAQLAAQRPAQRGPSPQLTHPPGPPPHPSPPLPTPPTPRLSSPSPSGWRTSGVSWSALAWWRRRRARSRRRRRRAPRRRRRRRCPRRPPQACRRAARGRRRASRVEARRAEAPAPEKHC